MSGSLAGQTTAYASAAAYFPQGAEQSFAYGNSVVPVYGYNSRLQMSSAYATLGNDPNLE